MLEDVSDLDRQLAIGQAVHDFRHRKELFEAGMSNKYKNSNQWNAYENKRKELLGRDLDG